MTAPNTAPEAAEVTPEQPMPTPAAMQPATPPASTSQAAPKRSLEDSLAALDAETRSYVLGEVQKARSEAKGLRDRVKESDPEKVKAELAQAVAKAMGITSEEPPDPAELTAQITAEKADARQARVELAVYRAAAGLGGDPAALLDSVAFVRNLASVDPTDTEAVQAAISAALDANPGLKVAPTRRLPGPNPALGSSAAGAPGIDEQIAAAKKAGDVRLWMHLENQKLAAPSR